jgi:hypothetical protein
MFRLHRAWHQVCQSTLKECLNQVQKYLRIYPDLKTQQERQQELLHLQ